ncbi:DUF1906 domain-containing protein [Corynebacterium uropygiale]|uniref:DUF1906 domain-containing protein n=1 Tax=Corynebacterium uropygiale TaxID=1775911 RepID=A0A9X1QPS4_9CORY|nr:DUF1906 domain-containing protein [Corynebacterium uropygiale]MCF4007347.1 DUF1906 domain-containing protein [Corynebacterium uropygiale]
MMDKKLHSQLSRRSLLRAGATIAAAGAVGATGIARAEEAGRPVLGTVLDYATGVPSAAAVKQAGHLGAVRYVTRPLPGNESWVLGKPVKLKETADFAAHGLKVASVYESNAGEKADWAQGMAGAAKHVPQAVELHLAAGGPTGRPIYVGIDDNPTQEQYTSQIRPYLTTFGKALEAVGLQLGVYANYPTIEWVLADGLCEFFWQHDWGSGGRIHPKAQIHQVGGWQTTVDGVTVDINNVYAEDWGQWTPGGDIVSGLLGK